MVITLIQTNACVRARMFKARDSYKNCLDRIENDRTNDAIQHRCQIISEFLDIILICIDAFIERIISTKFNFYQRVQ